MRRSTIILLILLTALGVLYWYMQKPGNAIQQAFATRTTTAPVMLTSLIGPDQGPVSRISIQSAAGQPVILENNNGLWQVTADRQGPANPDLAAEAAKTVMSLRLVTKLEKAPDPAGTGLDHPAYTVSLILLDGSPYTFKVGKLTVTESGYYILANDGSVVVVDKGKIDALTSLASKPPFLGTAPNP